MPHTHTHMHSHSHTRTHNIYPYEIVGWFLSLGVNVVIVAVILLLGVHLWGSVVVVVLVVIVHCLPPIPCFNGGYLAVASSFSSERLTPFIVSIAVSQRLVSLWCQLVWFVVVAITSSMAVVYTMLLFWKITRHLWDISHAWRESSARPRLGVSVVGALALTCICSWCNAS